MFSLSGWEWHASLPEKIHQEVRQSGQGYTNHAVRQLLSDLVLFAICFQLWVKTRDWHVYISWKVCSHLMPFLFRNLGAFPSRQFLVQMALARYVGYACDDWWAVNRPHLPAGSGTNTHMTYIVFKGHVTAFFEYAFFVNWKVINRLIKEHK